MSLTARNSVQPHEMMSKVYPYFLFPYGTWCLVVLSLVHQDETRSVQSHSEGHDLSTAHNLQRLLERCLENQYLKRFHNGTHLCLECSSCKFGEEILKKCARHRDTKCGGCRSGQFYLNTFLRPPACQRCQSCTNREVIRGCGEAQDRTCGECNPGYFLDELTEACVQCSYCWPEVPGFGIRIPECKQPDQPRDLTCLPSSPPRSLRRPRSIERPDLPATSRTDSVNREINEMNSQLKSMGRYVQRTVNSIQAKMLNIFEHLKYKL